MGLKNSLKFSNSIEKHDTGSALEGIMDPAAAPQENVRAIHVELIRMNPKNFYDKSTGDSSKKDKEDEEEMVKGLAKVLQKNGQDSHAIVYADDSPNDGKQYTLLAGARRLKAVRYNIDHGGDGILLCKVVPKPETPDEEIVKIIQNNGIRNKDPKIRAREVEELSVVYEHMKENRQQPKGRKIEWIGNQIGMSSRQVGRYLKEQKEDSSDTIEEKDLDPMSLINQEDSDSSGKMTKEEKSKLKGMANRLSKELGIKIRVHSNYSLVILPAEKSERGVENLLQQLHHSLTGTGGMD